jgi:hypothetical protein
VRAAQRPGNKHLQQIKPQRSYFINKLSMLVHQALAHGCGFTIVIVLLDAANAIADELLASRLRAPDRAPASGHTAARCRCRPAFVLAATTAHL